VITTSQSRLPDQRRPNAAWEAVYFDPALENSGSDDKCSGVIRWVGAARSVSAATSVSRLLRWRWVSQSRWTYAERFNENAAPVISLPQCSYPAIRMRSCGPGIMTDGLTGADGSTTSRASAIDTSAPMSSRVELLTGTGICRAVHSEPAIAPLLPVDRRRLQPADHSVQRWTKDSAKHRPPAAVLP